MKYVVINIVSSINYRNYSKQVVVEKMLRFRSLVAVAFLATAVHGIDYSIFRNCSIEPFCTKFRYQILDKNAQFYADVTNVSRFLNVVNVPLENDDGETLTLAITILETHKVRIKVLEPDHRRYDLIDVLVDDIDEYPPSVQKSADAVIITSNWAEEDKVVVRKGPPFVVEFYLQDQLEVVLNGDRLVMENTDSSQAFSFALEFEGASKLYGLAHHSYRLGLGETADGSSDPFRLKNTVNTGYDADSTMALYGAIPAIYGHSPNRTSGAFLHNAAQIFVDISYKSDRPSAYFMVECGSFDLFLFLGPTPKDVVRQYTSLTGVTRMPQIWVLGYHQSRFTYVSQEEVKEVVAKLDAADFPLDVIYLDDGYTNGNRYFQWNPENFTDPLEMQQNISATGRHMVAISDPHVAVDKNYFVYAEAKELDFYVKNSGGSDFQDVSWPGTSVWLDFLNPAVRDWYANLFLYEHFPGTTETIGGIWNDMNEPATFNNSTEKTFPPEVVHYGQVTDREIHNIYGLLHVKATSVGLEIRDNYEKRIFILSRSHFAGSQRYTAVWTGDNVSDWPNLRNSISECLTFNLLGTVICGADVGGFYTNPTDELFQRWYQAAIWIPYFRAHSNKGTVRREPYLFPEEIQAVLRLAVKTRYKHIPYWYLLMFEHTQSGDPLIRPLFYSYPEYLEYDDHLLIGEDILARPVLEAEVSEVQVTFPGSSWWYRVDDESWKSYEGGTEQNVAVNITTSPFFYRGGSIIARRDIERPSTTQMANDPFQLYVTLDAEKNAEGRLYFDDYVSMEFSTKKSYYYSRLIYDYASNGIRFVNISGNSEGFNARIQRIIVHQLGGNKKTLTTTYTTTKYGTLLEDIDIIKQQQSLRKQGDLVLYL